MKKLLLLALLLGACASEDKRPHRDPMVSSCGDDGKHYAYFVGEDDSRLKVKFHRSKTAAARAARADGCAVDARVSGGSTVIACCER